MTVSRSLRSSAVKGPMAGCALVAGSREEQKDAQRSASEIAIEDGSRSRRRTGTPDTMSPEPGGLPSALSTMAEPESEDAGYDRQGQG